MYILLLLSVLFRFELNLIYRAVQNNRSKTRAKSWDTMKTEGVRKVKMYESRIYDRRCFAKNFRLAGVYRMATLTFNPFSPGKIEKSNF